MAATFLFVGWLFLAMAYLLLHTAWRTEKKECNTYKELLYSLGYRQVGKYNLRKPGDAP